MLTHVINIRVSGEMDSVLRAASALTGESVGSLCRQAVSRFLADELGPGVDTYAVRKAALEAAAETRLMKAASLLTAAGIEVRRHE